MRDIRGNVIAPAIYIDISVYENGLAFAKVKDDKDDTKLGYLDLKGKFIETEELEFELMDYKGLKYYDFKIE